MIIPIYVSDKYDTELIHYLKSTRNSSSLVRMLIYSYMYAMNFNIPNYIKDDWAFKGLFQVMTSNKIDTAVEFEAKKDIKQQTLSNMANSVDEYIEETDNKDYIEDFIEKNINNIGENTEYSNKECGKGDSQNKDDKEDDKEDDLADDLADDLVDLMINNKLFEY